MCGILGKTLKTCWSKLRDQTKTGSQQIEQQQQQKRQTFEFPEVSSGGGRKKSETTHMCGGKRGGQKDRDGEKENLEGRGEHMAEKPDGVRRNVKIAVRKSVSE